MPLKAADVKKILLVADYGRDDLAFKEVQQQLYQQAKNAGLRIQIDIVSVDAFDTAETAAITAQAARSGLYDVVYTNTAPRKDDKSKRAANAGEKLAYAVFKKSEDAPKEVIVVGVYAENHGVNTFSLLEKYGSKSEDQGYLSEKVQHIVECPIEGTQFRSRNIFPEYVIKAIAGRDRLGKLDALPVPLPAENSDASQGKLDQLKKRVAGLLQEAAPEQQLAHHGDAARAYVTVVAGKDTALGNQALVDTVAEKLPGAEVDLIPLKSDKEPWLEAGFVAAQLALNSGYNFKEGEKAVSTSTPNRAIIVLPQVTDTLDNAAILYEAALDNGARIITSQLDALVFAKDRIAGDVKSYTKEDRTIGLDAEGVVVLGGHAETVEPEKWKNIAPPHPITPVYVDGYGNIKLSIRFDELLRRPGLTSEEGGLVPGENTQAHVSLNGREIYPYIANGSFSVPDGERALSKGSSGWPAKFGAAVDSRFTEIFWRGRNAAEDLGWPQPGDYVRIAPHHRDRRDEPTTSVQEITARYNNVGQQRAAGLS